MAAQQEFQRRVYLGGGIQVRYRNMNNLKPGEKSPNRVLILKYESFTVQRYPKSHNFQPLVEPQRDIRKLEGGQTFARVAEEWEGAIGFAFYCGG
jgi:hypothetical protein